MGGGLLQLVAYGAQDVYLTGNPQITFFKIVYRRHTNFAMESIEQSFNGNPVIGSRVSVLITRNGDLINRVYFRGTLENTNNTTGLALVPFYGIRLLKNVELEIGGQRIDKHYSEWMYIWNELSLPIGKRDGYNAMVGGNLSNRSIILQKEESKDICVPLEFWFCRNVGLALPLIALQYHEVKINIEFASKHEMCDTNNYNFSVEQTTNNSNFTSNDLELKNPQLYVDYIFLDTDERRKFAQLSHEYLIEQLQFTGSEKIEGSIVNTSLRNIRINFNHPCKELIWTIKPENITATDNDSATINDSVDGLNIINNNSGSLTRAYWNNFSNDSYNRYGYTVKSGIIKNPVLAAKLQLNGNDRFAQRVGDYFSIVQPYQHHENTPKNVGINVFSFALKPEEHQPSGTLNMSRIDTAHLQVASSKSGLISIYSINYNVLRILSGMGGLAYSN